MTEKYKYEGTIDLKIHDFNHILSIKGKTINIKCPSIRTAGFDWTLGIVLHVHPGNVDLFLECNNPRFYSRKESWQCPAWITFRIVSQNCSVHLQNETTFRWTFDSNRKNVFNSGSNFAESVFEGHFIPIEVLLNPDNGFLVNDILHFQAEVITNRPISVYRVPSQKVKENERDFVDDIIFLSNPVGIGGYIWRIGFNINLGKYEANIYCENPKPGKVEAWKCYAEHFMMAHFSNMDMGTAATGGGPWSSAHLDYDVKRTSLEDMRDPENIQNQNGIFEMKAEIRDGQDEIVVERGYFSEDYDSDHDPFL